MSKCPKCGGIVAYDSYFHVTCCTSITCGYVETSAANALTELRTYIDRWVDDGGDRDACYEALAVLAAAAKKIQE